MLLKSYHVILPDFVPNDVQRVCHSPNAALLVLGPSLLSKICEPRIFCLLPQVLGQLLDEGHEHGLGEGVVDRVEDLGGGQQLTGEDHQGQVIGGESRLECIE